MKKRRKKQSSDKFYWNSTTEEAIIWYQLEIDQYIRDQIWRTYLEYPFNKAAENIINRFKFCYLNQSFEDTKQQVVSFLVSNIHKYKSNKGKSFSYFSIIAKNYLILHNNTGWKEEKRSICLTDATDESASQEELINLQAQDDRDYDDVKEFITLLVDYWDNNVSLHFKKQKDKNIANSIIELFRRCNSIENFNKKALYNNIRDLTAISSNNTPRAGHITRIMTKMRTIIIQQYKNYNDYGVIDNNNLLD